MKNKVDPVQKEVDALNKVGQDLIQSAAPGVDVQVLEADLETLNNSMADINHKVGLFHMLQSVIRP